MAVFLEATRRRLKQQTQPTSRQEVPSVVSFTQELCSAAISRWLAEVAVSHTVLLEVFGPALSPEAGFQQTQRGANGVAHSIVV